MARLRVTKLPIPKAVVFPKGKAAKMVVPKILSVEQSAKQFATKSSVKPPNTKNLTKSLKSYL